MSAAAPARDALGELLDYLQPAEQVQLQAALKASRRRPLPDVEYQRNPVGWAVDVLGIPEETIRWSLSPEYAAHVWDGTPDPLVRLAEGIAAGEDVGVESATGTAKTYTLGWLCLWFAACFEPALVVTTAPKEDQLTKQLWKEIGRHWPAFSAAYPSALKQHLAVYMQPDAPDREGWAIIGWACGVEANAESATKAQGFHSANMLLVTEETPGVPAPVMVAFANTSTGSFNMRLSVGNPDNQHDSLHVFCTEPGVTHVRISALDSPNVVTGRDIMPGAATRKSVEKLTAKWGAESAMRNSRVRGISPPEAADALIRRAWLERAAERYHDARYRMGQRAKGVDVAESESGDKAAIADFQGACLLKIRSFPCPNALQLGVQVVAECRRDGVEPFHVGIDPVGVGSSTVNKADELTGTTGRVVQRLNGGSSPVAAIAKAPDGSAMDWVPDANEFANLRSQMWWQLRVDLETDQLAIPPEEVAPELWRQLTMPTFRVENGKTWVESKKVIRKRTGGKSPDDADAVVYGNWVRPRVPVAQLREPSDVEQMHRHPGYARVDGQMRPRDAARAIEPTDGPMFTTPAPLWSTGGYAPDEE